MYLGEIRQFFSEENLSLLWESILHKGTISILKGHFFTKYLWKMKMLAETPAIFIMFRKFFRQQRK